MFSNESETLLHRDLFGRMQPSWLMELTNQGDCTIAITFCCREGDITHPWQDIDTVTFDTQDGLNGERNIHLEFPITSWSDAPDLKLNVRLTQSTSEGSSSNVTLSNLTSGQESLGRFVG
ncbi:MAG: hypothetical protein V7L25_04680 [Nostoc sp.]